MRIGCRRAGRADSMQLVRRSQVASVQTIVRGGDLREQGRQQAEKLVRIVGVDVDRRFWVRTYARSTALRRFWCVVTATRVVSATILRWVGRKLV